MNTSNNIAVIGAGPIGQIYSHLVKAIYPDLNIDVLEQRSKPTRNHGLKISPDAIDKINQVLDEALTSYVNFINKEHVIELKNLFSAWRGSFVRTSTIENELSKLANKYGIKILRGEDYKFNEKNLKDRGKSDLEQTELQRVINNSHLLIGADGAHSAIAEAITSKKVEVETLQYLIELKYQTDGKALPRSYSEAFYETIACGRIDIETMNKALIEENKPITLHIFVDKDIYHALRTTDENGHLKGIFGNSWTLQEIKLLSKQNEKIKHIYKIFQTHLKGISERGGKCFDEQISTLDLTIFRREHSVVKLNDLNVLLCGDANSAMVIERGVCKGMIEAAMAATATLEYFLKDRKSKKADIPLPLIQYEKQTRDLFEKERNWARMKNTGIEFAQSSLMVSQSTFETSNSVESYSFPSFLSLLNWLSNTLSPSKASSKEN